MRKTTIINHRQVITRNRWYKPFPTLLCEPHYLMAELEWTNSSGRTGHLCNLQPMGFHGYRFTTGWVPELCKFSPQTWDADCWLQAGCRQTHGLTWWPSWPLRISRSESVVLTCPWPQRGSQVPEAGVSSISFGNSCLECPVYLPRSQLSEGSGLSCSVSLFCPLPNRWFLKNCIFIFWQWVKFRHSKTWFLGLVPKDYKTVPGLVGSRFCGSHFQVKRPCSVDCRRVRSRFGLSSHDSVPFKLQL